MSSLSIVRLLPMLALPHGRAETLSAPVLFLHLPSFKVGPRHLCHRINLAGVCIDARTSSFRLVRPLSLAYQ